MKPFFCGDIAVCRFENDSAWYLVTVLVASDGVPSKVLISSNAGVIALDRPILQILHVHCDYYPATNQYKNQRIEMEDGSLISSAEFCANHEVKMRYPIHVYGTSEVSRLTGE